MEEFGCSISHCCDETVYFIQSNKNQSDLGKVFGPVVWDKAHQSISMKVNTTSLGTW